MMDEIVPNEIRQEHRDRIKTLCIHCLTLPGIHKCTRCSTAIYCSKECQTLDWKLHKLYCHADHPSLPEHPYGIVALPYGHLLMYKPNNSLIKSYTTARQKAIDTWGDRIEDRPPHCCMCGDFDSETPLYRACNTVVCTSCLSGYTDAYLRKIANVGH